MSVDSKDIDLKKAIAESARKNNPIPVSSGVGAVDIKNAIAQSAAGTLKKKEDTISDNTPPELPATSQGLPPASEVKLPFFGRPTQLTPQAKEKFDLNKPLAPIDFNKPTTDTMLPGQQQQQKVTELGDNKVDPNKWQKLIDKSKQIKDDATKNPSTTEGFNGLEFIKNDIVNFGGGKNLVNAPTTLESLNQYFGNDATNISNYYNARKDQIDKQITDLQNARTGISEKKEFDKPVIDQMGIKKPIIPGVIPDDRTQEEKSIDAKVQEYKLYKQSLAVAQDQLAKKYVSWLYPTASVTEKGRMYEKFNGDENSKELVKLADKGVPLTQEQRYYTDIKGLDVDVQQLNDEYADKPKDDAYYQRSAGLQLMQKSILNKYPEYKKSQVANFVAQVAVHDPTLNMMAQIGIIGGDNSLHPEMIKYLNEKYGIEKEDLKGIEYGDIPNENAVSNIAKGLYNMASSVVQAGVRVGGTAFGIDEDNITRYNKIINESGNKIFGNNQYQHLQESPTIITPDLQTIPNPRAQKYNYTGAAISNAIGDGIGNLLGFIVGIKGTKLATSLSDDAAMTSYLIGSGYEPHYQKAGEIMGKDASEFSKGLYAVGMGYIDAVAFRFIPKDKLFMKEGEAGWNVKTNPWSNSYYIGNEKSDGVYFLANALKDMSVKKLDKSLLETGVKKVLKKLFNTTEETVKIGGAMTVAEMAKTVVNVMAGDSKDASKYIQEGVENIEHLVRDLPMSMAIPLGLMEIPKQIEASQRMRETLFDAGDSPEKYIATIMEARSRGLISTEDAAKKIEVAGIMNKVVKSLPETNPKTGEPFTHSQEVEYAFNRLQEIALMAKANKVKDDKPLFDHYTSEAKKLIEERYKLYEPLHNMGGRPPDTKTGTEEPGTTTEPTEPKNPEPYRNDDFAKKNFSPEEYQKWNDLKETDAEKASEMIAAKREELKTLIPDDLHEAIRATDTKLKDASNEDVMNYAIDKVAEAPTKMKNDLGDQNFDAVMEKVPTEKLQEGLDFLLKNNPDSPDVKILDAEIKNRTQPPEDLEEKGKPIGSHLEAERRFANGDRIFAFSEQDEEPKELFSVDVMKTYTPEQLLAYETKPAEPAEKKKSALEKLKEKKAKEKQVQQQSKPKEPIQGNESEKKKSEIEAAADEFFDIKQKKDVTEKKQTPTKTTGGGSEEVGKIAGGEKIKVFKRRAKSTIKSPLYLKALDVESQDPVTQVMQYFIAGGRVHRDMIEKLFSRTTMTGRKNVGGEIKARFQFTGKHSERSLRQMAHDLWDGSSEEVQSKYDDDDFENAVENVLLNHNSRTSMAEELIKTHIGGFDEIDEAWQQYYDSAGEGLTEEEHGELDKAIGILDGLSDDEIKKILDTEQDALNDSDFVQKWADQYEEKAEEKHGEEIELAKRNLEKAERKLREAQDEIAKKQSKQSDMFGGGDENVLQKDLFANQGEDVRAVLEPLKQKVREARAALDEIEKQVGQKIEGSELAFDTPEPSKPQDPIQGDNAELEFEPGTQKEIVSKIAELNEKKKAEIATLIKPDINTDLGITIFDLADTSEANRQEGGEIRQQLSALKSLVNCLWL